MDVWIGIALVMIGDVALMGFAAAIFVSLATAYAIGDVLSLWHSLHRKPEEAKGFYGVYFALIFVAAVLVLTPGTPLGLLTNAVQTLAGVLLPSATVLLLLLYNDRAILGPRVNGRAANISTGAIVAVLVILTAPVLFPGIGFEAILAILAGEAVLGVAVWLSVLLFAPPKNEDRAPVEPVQRETWRMPPLGELPPAELSLLSRIWMAALRGYLVVAAGLVLVRIAQLALSSQG